MIAEQATGYPGYDAIIGRENAAIGEILKENGYATSWFGKNHNTPGYEYSLSGPFDQWPSGMGFEYFYGFMGGETDQWRPWLFRDHTQIFPWVENPGYNLITDMADEAINHIKGLNAAAPDQPFFVYYAPGGSHAPHQPTPEWIKKISDMHLFDKGWNELREQIFANQKRLGVIPPNTQLTPWPDGQPEYGGAKLAKWDTLSPDEKKLFIRQADVFAAYAAYTDHEIGRVIQEVARRGQTRQHADHLYLRRQRDERGRLDCSELRSTWLRLKPSTMPVAEQLKYYDDWGSDKTQPHMAVAWAWAFDTPFKWTKQIASHFGGTRQGLAISWPGHITDVGGIRTQFHHLIDIAPTILEAAGIPAPVMVNGIAQKPIEGVSMAYTFDKANANAPSKRDTQYFEMMGNRAIYHDGWIAATTPPAGTVVDGHRQNAGCGERLQLGALQHRRGLFGVQRPRYQDARQASRDAGALPGRGIEIQRVSARQRCAPARCSAPRPSPIAGKTVFTYSGEVSGTPEGSAPNTPQQVLLHHRRGGNSAGRRRGNAEHDRWRIRRLWPLSGQGQAGLHLRATHCGTFPMGRPGGPHAR